MTYLSEPLTSLPPLPVAVQVIPVGDGSLLILTEEPFTVTNPEHVRRAEEAIQCLQAAGLWQPGTEV